MPRVDRARDCTGVLDGLGYVITTSEQFFVELGELLAPADTTLNALDYAVRAYVALAAQFYGTARETALMQTASCSRSARCSAASTSSWTRRCSQTMSTAASRRSSSSPCRSATLRCSR